MSEMNSKRERGRPWTGGSALAASPAPLEWQAHFYSPLLRGEWHTTNRDSESSGAKRGYGPTQQVNDAVTSGWMISCPGAHLKPSRFEEHAEGQLEKCRRS